MNLKQSKYIGKYAFTIFSFFGFFLSSSCFEIFKTGGAIPENTEYLMSPYVGILNYMPHVWILIVIFSFILFLPKNRLSIHPDKAILFVVVLFFYLLLSVFLSEYPNESLNNYVLILSFAVFAIAHIGFSDVDAVVSDIEFFFIFSAFASYFIVFFFPEYGLSIGRHAGYWQGIFSHKNNLGIACSIAISFILFGSKKSSLSLALKLAAVFFLVIKSGSYTSIFVSIFIFLFWLYSLKIKTGKIQASLIISVLVFLCFVVVIISQANLNVSLFGKGADFSSRSLIWALTLKMALEKPLLGHGLAVFQQYADSYPEFIKNNIGEVIRSTHNGFLDTFFSLGLVGIILSIIFLFFAFQSNFYGRYFYLSLAISIVFVVSNMFESRFFTFNNLIFILIYLFFIGVKFRIFRNKMSSKNV